VLDAFSVPWASASGQTAFAKIDGQRKRCRDGKPRTPIADTSSILP